MLIDKHGNYEMSVNFKEMCLLLAIRNKYRFGEVVVVMRDGIPVRILHAFESDELDDPKNLTDDSK